MTTNPAEHPAEQPDPTGHRPSSGDANIAPARDIPSGSAPPVLCLGEAMVAFAPSMAAAAARIPGADGSSALSEAAALDVFVAGAEANVAIGLARAGQSVEWFGRVGDDPFGARIRSHLAARGVVVDAVIPDSQRPTGLYFKDRAGSRSTMFYYRSGSAASAMGPADAAALRLAERRLVHVSGITPALSESCDSLVESLLDAGRGPGAPAVSFDVNHRSKLWSADTAAPRLLALARKATIVLVGRDEAEMLWGTATPAEIRSLLAEVPFLVVKDADIGATEFAGDAEVFVPAMPVDVVEPIGAGDAFAAGYLAGWIAEEDSAARLRRGHQRAAEVLGQISDS